MRLFRFGFLKEGLIQTVLEMIKTGYYERGHWSHQEQVWTQRQREGGTQKGRDGAEGWGTPDHKMGWVWPKGGKVRLIILDATVWVPSS